MWIIIYIIYLSYILLLQEKNPLHITSIATTNDDFLKKCAPRVKCDPYAKYRSANGSCNNLGTPTWGAAKTPFLRMIDANYSDGNILNFLTCICLMAKVIL